MFKSNSICDLFKIKLPIVQGGMAWNSGWKLAAAVSNAGGLGLIGSATMYPDVLEENILKCKNATKLPFGVNITLMYPELEKHVELIIKHKVPVVFTSAGNPKLLTKYLKSKNITVVHVVSSLKFAQKAVDAGVDALVGEGFEAGGHNGIEETTTLCLIPMLARTFKKTPIIAAGGIARGEQILAGFALGADGVQIGTRFAATPEAYSHEKFKQKITTVSDGDTILTLKEIGAVRLIKNNFYNEIEKAYEKCASPQELKDLLGNRRSKKGMLEGDLENGELEVGQSAYLINDVKPVSEVMDQLIREFKTAKESIIV